MKEAFKDSKEKSLFCAKVALEKKAFDITILELKRVSSLTDYFLICSGRSDRQVQAIAQFIEEKMKERGVRPLGVEGMQEGRWVLMDYEDVVIHIFYEPIRLYYDLEGLWIEAPRVNPPEEKG
ncbi:MAG: ribosome silencing factor [Deltaproteobacteria bacterium]|nr:MAG: ribosome silencing factor [Deltaproteobacteria bacterium]